MATVIDQCPHCGVRHVQTKEEASLGFAPSLPIVWKALRCQNPACHKLVLAVGHHVQNKFEIATTYPARKYGLDPNLPVSQEIREDYSEAGTALNAGCFKSSMVMSRRALQRCLKEQGCTQRNLVDAIDHAIKNAILRPALHQLAEEVRRYGNLGAHPDDDQLQNATRQNAQHVLEFLDLIVRDFYEIPAVAARLKKNRSEPAP